MRFSPPAAEVEAEPHCSICLVPWCTWKVLGITAVGLRYLCREKWQMFSSHLFLDWVTYALGKKLLKVYKVVQCANLSARCVSWPPTPSSPEAALLIS